MYGNSNLRQVIVIGHNATVSNYKGMGLIVYLRSNTYSLMPNMSRLLVARVGCGASVNDALVRNSPNMCKGLFHL